MDNYDENVDELDETSSSNSINLKNVSKNTGKIIDAPRKMAQNTGKTVETTGKAVQTAGKAVETTGKVAQKAGQVTQKAGQGIGKAGDSMMNAGKALSSSGYGAIAGVPLAALGGLTKAAGVGTEIAGKGTEIAGKGAEAAGKGTQKAGEEIQKAGNSINQAGQAINNGKKSIEKTVNGNKNLKKFLVITGAIFPFILIFMLIFASVVATMLPIFSSVTFVGGKTIYGDSADDLPQDLTETGIYTWSEEEKRMFETLKNEKQIYEDGFKKYNAYGILANNNETFDVTMPLATIHYMGTVNLMSYDGQYKEDIFTNGSSSLEYNGESNVENTHTKDFYQKAALVTGNTFMIYPGIRMLTGHLVGNDVSFVVRQYKINDDGTSNASEIYSDWSYLGKITSSNKTSASISYSVSGAISQMENAINVGKNFCKSNLNVGNAFDPSEMLGIELGDNEEYSISAKEYYDFFKDNVCYDTDLIYDEIFGEKFDGSIVDYLNERFEDDNHATVPTGTLVNNHYYITVNVNKKIDYDKYQEYLKEVYIPYYYINCSNCKYKDASEDVKESQSQSILKEIMNLTDAFKYYNNEDLIGDGHGSSLVSGGGTFGTTTYLNGNYADLPQVFYSQLTLPFVDQKYQILTSCFGYYDAVPNTKYYCERHNAVDIIGGNATIASPADGVISSCRFDSYGPYLEITHTLKDENNNDVQVISYYRHWLDMNGNRSCETFYEGKIVKQGEGFAKESGQGGTGNNYGVHLHFGIKSVDGTLYNVENYLLKLGVATNNETNNCNEVRRICSGKN